ncbi:MAG: CPBP family intramembrane glutamic endopeptidase [Litorimonas sp.]
MNYYDRSQNGDVRWYDWIAVFWLTIVVWIIGQLAFTSPFSDMLTNLDPKAGAQLNDLMASGMDPQSLAYLGFGSIVLLFGIPMATIAYGVHYLGTQGKPSQITGLIGALLSFVGGGLFIAGTSGMGEANSLILSVIGLSPVAYMLMLLTFPAALVGLYLGWKLVHKRPLTALHTAFSKFRWKRAIQAFLIMWVVLGTYGFIMSRFSDNPPEFVFDAARFLPYAILSLLLLPIQSATEEIVVRGYMNKGLIHWFGNKWVVFTLTSGLFMALHLANPEAKAAAEAGNLPIIMSGYFFFGFAMCLMVLIDDGLESAIGVHAGNNTFAAIFVNYENSVLPTPSVWQVKAEPTGDAITVIIILSIVLALLYITRKPRAKTILV